MRRISGLIIITVLFISCSDNNVVESPDNIFQVTIVSPLAGTQFNFGDSIIIKTEASNSTKIISQILFVNGYKIDSTNSNTLESELSGIDYRPGEIEFIIKAEYDYGTVVYDSVKVFINAQSTPVYQPKIIKAYPHDPGAFTQGLQYFEGFLYEGTGLNGKSSIRKVELESGTVLMQKNLDNNFFGEGITIYNRKIYQLTWLNKTGFIYSVDTFDSLGTFTYDSQGWGLTLDNNNFILSNGSQRIALHDLENFNQLGLLEITENGLTIQRLNELELIKGDLFANVWQSDRIARISLTDGKVIGWIDLSSITVNETGGVLNGIAYRENLNHLLITGKNWNNVYEIELEPAR